MFIAADQLELNWPFDRPRTAPEARRADWPSAPQPPERVDRMRYLDVLGRLGVEWAQLSFQPPYRPVSNAFSRPDPGVACYFDMLGARHVIACDHSWSVRFNLLEVISNLEGLVTTRNLFGEQQMRDTLAILRVKDPIPSWCRFYGFDAIPTRSKVEKAHRKLVLQAHPDRGGTEERMRELNHYIAQARAYFDSKS